MDVPLIPGLALVNGFAGEHSERRAEAAALAPYPVAGDLAINGIWLSDAPNLVRDLEQAYDFATGEVTSRFTFCLGDLCGRHLRQPGGSDTCLPRADDNCPSGL